MSVLNKAHVDAQFPLVTEVRSLVNEVRTHHQTKTGTNGNVTRVERR